MSYNSLVLVKQVPDTANISGEVMKPDGTVNRAMLPAVFNPEDKSALDLALQVRDRFGGTVKVITMGPPKAAELLRECLYMGADEACLISDRKFAGADTLATSYVLAKALEKIGNYDFIFGGRQAIDGDTAQVGPQTAEKLGIPQVTYTEEVLNVRDGKAKIKRKIDGGFEIIEAVLPVLLTVLKGSSAIRPFRAKRVMAYKNARTIMELEEKTKQDSSLKLKDLKEDHISRDLFIPTITVKDLDVKTSRIGLHGSPTKVHKVESVVLGASGHEKIEPTKEGLGSLIDKLMEDHIFG